MNRFLLALLFAFGIQNAHCQNSQLQKAAFAAGCFWCAQEAFEKVPGVTSVVSGYTGGGKELIEVHEKNPDVEPFGLYGVELTHKHVPEMKKYSGLKHAPLFVPSVGHYAQGMLIMVPITRDIVARKVNAADVHKVLADYYAGETFVPVRPLADRKWLERDRFLRADRLIDTNSMELAVYGNEAEEQILAVASLDNLGKGASGAAVQVINLKTGVDETTGLAVAA